jgi:hypothetical protein
MKTIENINKNSMNNLQNDNVYVSNSIVNLDTLTGMPSRKGLEQAVISNGKIVNVVSQSYGHLPNEKFFGEVENQLKLANVEYVKRAINRNDSSFAVDYILNDDSFIINTSQKDSIMPMLRFTNSYDGTNKTSGHFGFFRKICANGLHVAQSNIGFGLKHRGEIVEVVLPEVSQLIQKFFANEYYTLSRKFEVMNSKEITDLKGFVKLTAEKTNLFKFEASEKNPEPSLNARKIMEGIEREADILGVKPNLWLGYNAFNELLHDKLKKTFEQQKNIDSKIFDTVLEMV